MTPEGKILISKLDEFIRKYYKNQLIRGTVITVTVLSVAYLAFVLLEYALWFGPGMRLLLFYTFVLSALALLVLLMIIPFLRMQKVLGRLSYEEAARLIGEHFPEISDKLLNTLQLMDKEQDVSINLPLLLAGIDQKIKMIRPFPFTRVINLRMNIRYLKYALPPLLVILIGLIVAPSVISVPAERILRYNNTFNREFPFSFRILNSRLEAIQQGDFELKIEFSGEEIPSEVFIRTDGTAFRMKRGKGFLFTHLFRTLNKDLDFTVVAGEMVSNTFRIKVIPRPVILNFETLLEFPGYIQRADEKVGNTGDLNVPEGTTLTWNFETKDVESIRILFSDEKERTLTVRNDAFSITKKAERSVTYSLKPANAYVRQSDSMIFRITVIPDEYPSIQIQETLDSAMAGTLFFRGAIKDDYGFSRLIFHYEIRKRDDTVPGAVRDIPVSIDRALSSQLFFHAWEPDQTLLGQGEEIRYYFEVWDNDGVHGPKFARSETGLIKTPTIEEIEQKTAENGQNIMDGLESGIQESEAVQKNINDLNRKMVEKSTLNFQEKAQLENLIKSNEKILQKIEEIKKRNLESMQNNEEYLKASESILEKQRKLNELLNQLMTEEMKKLMQEIRDLMEKVDKAKLSETLEKLKMSQKDIEEQLDRNLQLFKQLEFDRKLEQTVRNLRDLAEQQKKLAEKSDSLPEPGSKTLDEQKGIREAFDSIRSALDQLSEQEKELENPPGLRQTKSQQDSVGKSLKQTEELLNQGKMKKSSESQKKSSRQMDNLANQLEQMGMDAEMDQMGEDAAQIRMILESLVRMSFEQESLMAKLTMINRNDPKFQQVITEQKEMRDKLTSAKDSLIAISKRQFLLAPVITREIKSIDANLEAVMDALNIKNMTIAQSKQQFAMTAINNLAVLLDESLKQMQESMKNSIQGGGSKMCNKPSNSGGNQKIKGIKEMQQKMSDQLKQMKEGLEKEGKKQDGKQAQGKGSMNEQIARLAAQQEAIRNEMQRYKEALEEQGIKDGGNAANAIQEMEQNERDLINKKITQETLMRQQKIMSRLLESEKAEMEREKEEKRESSEQKEQLFRNFTSDFLYNNMKTGGKGILEYKSTPLNLFYRNKINQYMIKIGQ